MARGRRIATHVLLVLLLSGCTGATQPASTMTTQATATTSTNGSATNQTVAPAPVSSTTVLVWDGVSAPRGSFNVLGIGHELRLTLWCNATAAGPYLLSGDVNFPGAEAGIVFHEASRASKAGDPEIRVPRQTGQAASPGQPVAGPFDLVIRQNLTAEPWTIDGFGYGRNLDFVVRIVETP